MNYEKMWNDLKWYIAGEMGRAEVRGQSVNFHKNLMVHMSIMEASEYERESSAFYGQCEPDKNAGRKKPEEKSEANKKKTEGSKPVDLIRDAFGNDYTDNLADLEMKLMEKGRKLIITEEKLEIPERIMDLARERKISIARVSRHTAKIGTHGFSFPHSPFLNGGRFA